MLRRNTGLSLLEYVIGLAILAMVLVGVGLFFLSQPRQLDPVFQFRAVSLAEALAEQVLAVKYDDNNKPDKQQRCPPNCTRKEKFGPDGSESEIGDFDDVDDFNLWCNGNTISGNELADQLGLGHTELYARYSAKVCVDSTNEAVLKLVNITIQDQNGADLSFTLHRYNIR